MIEGTQKIVIAGAGGIGRAVGLLLGAWSDFPLELAIGDRDLEVARRAASDLSVALEGSAALAHPVRAFHLPEDSAGPDFARELDAGALLLDCLPGGQAPRMARLALAHDLHYANLTEYVAESREIEHLAAGARRGFVLQTGLAPGFVDVLAHHLYGKLRRDHGVDTVDRLSLRVGALPVSALPPHFYAFTWSPVGVATEYVEDAVVVRDGATTTAPSLTEVATVRLGSLVLEEALTSGGAADLPDALAGQVRELDYKTFRHPGHWAWVRQVIDRLETEESDAPLPRRLEQAMLDEIPRVENDQVVIYAAATGRGGDGFLRRQEEMLVIGPREVAGQALRAIQLTTAAGLAESARLLLDGGYSGPVLQSQIDPEDYLAGRFVQRAYYGAADQV